MYSSQPTFFEFNFKKIRNTSFAMVVPLLLLACNKGAPPASQPTIPLVGVYEVNSQRVSVFTELPGRTSPYQIAEVRPQINGIVQKRLFTEGRDVKAGELLYQIDPSLYKAAFDSAEANLQSIQLKFERYKELIKVNAVSKQEYDDVDASYKQALAAMQTAQINLRYTQIASPISGRVGISNITPGALVSANQANALTTVQQLDPIYVDVIQSSTELMRIKRALESGVLKRAGQDAVKMKLILDDNIPYALEGKFQFSDVTVDSGTGSVTLRAVFPNPKHDLLPGMFVRAVLEEGVNEKGLVVPQQGVTHDARGNATALVLNKESKVELRILELGEAIGDKWVVKSGLNVGDQLIVDGVQKIKPGGSAQAAPKDAPKDSTKDSSMEPNKDSKQDATKSTNMPDPSQALSKSAEKAVK
jgi:membrane fusion protein (multidrug efflux system)